jgi:hypothetical protein
MVFVFPVLMLLSALALSGLAAYISILGLMQIFPGSIVHVIALGEVNMIAWIAIAMEAAKVILAGALHLYWKRFLGWMKLLFTAQIIVLMIITAIGIFGFLSKSARLPRRAPAPISRPAVRPARSAHPGRRPRLRRACARA